MKILVTGADGFIGSHLVESLVKRNYKVRATVLYNSLSSNGWIDTLNKETKNSLEICPGDIKDQIFTDEITRNIDSVFHLAALISIPYCYKSVSSFIDTNIIGTKNLLESSTKNKVKKFIHTSTSEVFGNAKTFPISEEHNTHAFSPYAATKIAADNLAMAYYKTYKTPVTILRPFNTFGPRQSARAIIPTIITQMLNSDIVKLGNTNTKRNFNYVDDIVDAYILTLKKDLKGERINIGSRFEISIKDLVILISKLLKKKVKIKIDKNRVRPKTSEVFRLISSNVKAKKILNWEPKCTNKKGFEECLKKTLEWFLDYENFKKYDPNLYKF